MTMLTVIVTGVGGGVGQGIIKALRLIPDLKIRIVGVDMDPRAAGLYFCDAAAIIPAASCEQYVDAVIGLCRQHKADFFIPGTDYEVPVCARNHLSIQESGTVPIVSPSATVEVTRDKFATYELLKRHGLDHPQTWLAEDTFGVELPYPVVVKPRVGSRSVGMMVAHSLEELRESLAAGRDLIVQECIGSVETEYTCTMVAAGSRRSDVAVLRRRLRNGDTYKAESVVAPAIADYVLSIARLLDIEGNCNFQLRVDGEGHPKLFEINARFSGTTPICAMLGFNPVEYYILTKLGRSYQPSWQSNMMVLRLWSAVVLSATRSGSEITWSPDLDATGEMRPNPDIRLTQHGG
jgi:carbamoyl-phosphate synthase large subunit